MALHRYALIACLVGLLLPACKQDEDQACQVNTDCSDGLVCNAAQGSLHGTCVHPDEVQDEPVDSGTDAETVDPDASIPRDASDDDDAG